MASNFVTANPNRDPSQYVHTGDNAIPGAGGDCSGMMSACQIYAGYGSPNYGNGQFGVQNIQNNTTPVTEDQIQEGNYITFYNTKAKKYPYHIGIIDQVFKDESGKTIGVSFMHSAGSSGPTQDQIYFGDGSFYDNIRTGFYKWDTEWSEISNHLDDKGNLIKGATTDSYLKNLSAKEVDLIMEKAMVELSRDMIILKEKLNEVEKKVKEQENNIDKTIKKYNK